MNFAFPVTALIGPNGAGKSTILGACACVYKSVSPEQVFRKSKIGDASMDDWLIEYELLERAVNPIGTIRAGVSFKDDHWMKSLRVNRSVKQCTLNRTVPPVDNPLFSHKSKLSVHGKFAKRRQVDITSTVVSDIQEIKRESERVFGRSLRDFTLHQVVVKTHRQSSSRVRIRRETEKIEELGDGRRRITQIEIGLRPSGPGKVRQSKILMYVGAADGHTYSEFNFGSGESSVIRMVADIETLPENSLVLIEEIENGLHPVAVRRMVEYLIDVAERKSIQSVFTTHSDYALEPLPSEAIWACLDGTLRQGKLSVKVLRAVTGRVNRRLAIFVEDAFSAEWVTAIVREYLGDHFEEIGVYALQGDGNAVKTHTSQQCNPAISFRSLCFIDGDSRQNDDASHNILRLPGADPESTVFDGVLHNLESNIALLTAALQRPQSKQEDVRAAVSDVSHTNRDPHLLFSQVGAKIGFVPEATVRGAFISVWIEEHRTESQNIANAIDTALRLPAKC